MHYPLSSYYIKHCFQSTNSCCGKLANKHLAIDPCSWNAVIIMFTIDNNQLKQLVWYNDLLKIQLQHQLGGNTLKGRGKVLQKVVYALNQHLIYRTVYPIAKIYRSKNQKIEMGVAQPTITIFDPCYHDFILRWIWSLGSKGKKASTRRHKNDSTELELKTATQPLWTSHASKSSKEGSDCAGWVNDPVYQRRNWTATPR